MRVRSVLFVTAGVVGAAVGGAVVSAALSDPDVNVEAIELDGVAATAPATQPSAAPSVSTPPTPAPGPAETMPVTVQEVVGLEQLVGELRAGEDLDDWYVAGVEVDVGPEGWISAAPATGDFDGDGVAEPLLLELQGLEGRTVTLGVRYEAGDDDRDDADVFTIEGISYRDSNGALAPWQSAPAGVEASPEEIAAAAETSVGDGAVAIEVDRETEDGWRGWDVEVRAADGREYQVLVDLAGNVLDVRLDVD